MTPSYRPPRVADGSTFAGSPPPSTPRFAHRFAPRLPTSRAVWDGPRPTNPLRRGSQTVAAIAWVWGSSALAWANEAAGGDHGTEHAGHEAGIEGIEGIEWITPIFGNPGKTGILWLLVNFGALMWILNRILFRPLRARQLERHESVKRVLAEATAARNSAETFLREYNERIDRLDEEVQEILDDAKRRAQADRRAIIEDATREARRLREAALATAERDALARRRAIENEVIERAVGKAESLLRSRMGGMDHQRMVGTYIDQLAALDLSGKQAPRGDGGAS